MGGTGDTRDYTDRTPGGGGAAAGGATGGGTGETDSCARLTFPAVVSSPEPEVVSTLVPTQLLNVVPTERNGVPLVELQTTDGRLAGTLTSSLPELLRCIDAGYSYVAEVLSIDGGAVQVQVRNAPVGRCEDVTFTELLAGSDEAVTAGEHLDVVLAGRIVEVRTTASEVIGTVTTHLAQLLPCLIGGQAYVAIVTDAADGRVEVDIRPAS